jgi:ribosome-binding protein aMBF1 (putative translation factor)
LVVGDRSTVDNRDLLGSDVCGAGSYYYAEVLMTVLHVEAKLAVSDRINTLAEQVYALKNAYDDEVAKSRSATVRNDNRKKLSKSEVDRMRRLYEHANWSQAALADAFDVNPATVSRTVRGIYHK